MVDITILELTDAPLLKNRFCQIVDVYIRLSHIYYIYKYISNSNIYRTPGSRVLPRRHGSRGFNLEASWFVVPQANADKY